MINEQDIKQVAVRLGTAANALRVILFGSYARGDADSNSDVDFMIITESDLPRYKRSRDLYKLFRPYPFGMDIIVYTPQEIEKAKKSPISFVSNVLKEGITLYIREDDAIEARSAAEEVLIWLRNASPKLFQDTSK